jgi:hypothetical protein
MELACAGRVSLGDAMPEIRFKRVKLQGMPAAESGAPRSRRVGT